MAPPPLPPRERVRGLPVALVVASLALGRAEAAHLQRSCTSPPPWATGTGRFESLAGAGRACRLADGSQGVQGVDFVLAHVDPEFLGPDCASACEAHPGCRGFEAGLAKRCEIWLREPQHTIAVNGYECFRRGSELANASAGTVWSAPSASFRAPLQKVMLDRYPLAVCMDGTPAGYYLRRGSGDIFLIWLGGGSWCVGGNGNLQKCLRRYWGIAGERQEKGASYEAFGADLVAGSILESATVAYGWYCTGDAFAGDTVGAEGEHYRGRQVVRAIVDDLLTRQGLGSSPRHRLAVGGCSSGARGALYNEEAVTAQLAAAGVAFAGLLLSSPLAVTQEDIVQKAWAKFNLSGVAGTRCLAAQAGTPWRCFLPHVRLKYSTERRLLVASTTDTMADMQIDQPELYRRLVLDAASNATSSFVSSCIFHCPEHPNHVVYSVDCASQWLAMAAFLAGEDFHLVDTAENHCNFGTSACAVCERLPGANGLLNHSLPPSARDANDASSASDARTTPKVVAATAAITAVLGALGLLASPQPEMF